MPSSKKHSLKAIPEDQEQLISRSISESIDVEKEIPPHWHTSKPQSSKHSLIVQYATCFLVILTLLAVLVRGKVALPKGLQQKRYADCGKSPAEAMVKGCIFDIMNYAWTPPACYDEEYSKASLLAGPWKWYADKNATQPLPHDQEILGQHTEVWTESSYHIAHCMYAQGLIHRAAKGKRPVMGEIGIWNHTLHCQRLFMKDGKVEEQDPPETINTWVRTQWTPCVYMSKGLWEL